MIRVLAEQRTVYRSEVGRRGRMTKRAAYRDAAWQAWSAKYPCTCEPLVSAWCGMHGAPDDEPDAEHAEHRRKVIDRLARWLRWRDSRLVAIAMECVATEERERCKEFEEVLGP